MTANGEENLDRVAVEGIDVDVDDLFDVLANPRRRFVIACLDMHSEPMAITDVADELARWECDASTDHTPKEQVDSRHIALHHAHLPKMADAGIITYDEERKTVALVDESDGMPMEVLPSLE